MSSILPDDWDIETELLRLTGESKIEKAIYALALNCPGQEFIRIEGAPTWIRGGSETYIYPFVIICTGEISNHFILKAIVSFSPINNLDRVTKHWIDRRFALNEAQIRVPKVFYWEKGLILEEYIPFELSSILKNNQDTSSLLEQLFRYASVLYKLGFEPIAPFDDLRTDRKHVIPVDFGEDLGPSGLHHKSDNMQLFNLCLNWLNKHKIPLLESSIQQYRQIYLLSCG